MLDIRLYMDVREEQERSGRLVHDLTVSRAPLPPISRTFRSICGVRNALREHIIWAGPFISGIENSESDASPA